MSKVSVSELLSLSQKSSLSISFAVIITTAYSSPDYWLYIQEYEMLLLQINDFYNKNPFFLPVSPDNFNLRDNRGIFVFKATKDKIKVFTDYPQLLKIIGNNTSKNNPILCKYEFVDDSAKADFLFIIRHISDYMKLPVHQKICQFPFEGSLVRKDLLLLTIRKFCFKKEANEMIAPFYWLPSYDLSTEFHLFKQDFHSRKCNWILKPSQGARGEGHKLFKYEDDALKDIASFLLLNSSERVAQKLISNPCLINQRNADLRIIVLVRSFEPFSAFITKYYFARLANKEYNSSDLSDIEVTMTVTCYNENPEIANRQERMTHSLLARGFGLDEVVGIDSNGNNITKWTLVDKAIHNMMWHIFSSAGKGIGCWPRSCAYYSVDVMLDWDDILETQKIPETIFFEGKDIIHDLDYFRKNRIPIPRLLEINFMGDLHGMEIAINELIERSDNLMEEKDISQSQPTHPPYYDWLSCMFDCMLDLPNKTETYSKYFVELKEPEFRN